MTEHPWVNMLQPVSPLAQCDNNSEQSDLANPAAVVPSSQSVALSEQSPVFPPPDVPPGSQRVKQPKPLPEIKPPTAAEEARHKLTHLPYRRWCRWCVQAKMLNMPHYKLPPFSRDLPLMVMDYCFVKSGDDPQFLTVLVGKLYPYKTVFAVACPKKGPDQYVTRRLAGFLRQCGINRMNYMRNFDRMTWMSDQEPAIRAMFVEAMEVVKASGEYLGAVPEVSAVGESQSNSRAERTVQQVEDQIRTLLAELEAHVGMKISCQHPILTWLVEYAATLLNKYHVNNDEGKTAYELLHGHDVDEKLAIFGEKVFFHIPAKRRSNLDLRWSVGTFLGTLMHSNECWVALPTGDVVRSRGVARVRADQSWDRRAI